MILPANTAVQPNPGRYSVPTGRGGCVRENVLDDREYNEYKHNRCDDRQPADRSDHSHVSNSRSDHSRDPRTDQLSGLDR